jgi:cobalt/nickel transport protein
MSFLSLLTANVSRLIRDGFFWFIIIAPAVSHAHFQEIIPDRDFLDQNNQQSLRFLMRFTHPMSQGPIMDMLKPRALTVITRKKRADLLADLEPISQQGIGQWSLDYSVTEPGDHVFILEPQPYWEASEGKMIIHYSKVIVDAYGEYDHWHTLNDLPVEILALARPYSLWAGNAFSGIVYHQGKPLPFADVEVEWRNDGSIQAPTNSYITQVIKADANGTFNYVMPRAGWWGFAALIDADYQLQAPTGEQVPVELGGLIWINAK